MRKFFLKCKKCGAIIETIAQWFASGQKCSICEAKHIEVFYSQDTEKLENLIFDAKNVKNIFHYFDFLPLEDEKNIISVGEGIVPFEKWNFLEEFAKKYFNINCEVIVSRNDLNAGTGTFKDAAAALAASVLKENHISQYVVASTGNTANSFAYYLALAGISLYVFIPNDALRANEAEISSCGQRVFRVDGDYAVAKKMAAEFSQRKNILITTGNTDILRVEAKKTMVFEFLRCLSKFPDVYIQAVAGGTGPIALAKGISEVKSLVSHFPRLILVQPSGCSPMVESYQNAVDRNFPQNWEQNYPIYENPKTSIPTLANGVPATFPILAPMVRESEGNFVEVQENQLVAIARLVAFETLVKIGPASAVAVGGFFESLRKNLIKNNDVVLLNLGEGTRKAPEFLEEMIFTTQNISSLDECLTFQREDFRKELWENVLKNV